MTAPGRSAIRFLLNGEHVEAGGLSPQTTLLQWLRESRALVGTKEGCAEGDCGACTVVLAELTGEGLAWKPVNACIRLLPSLDGKAIFTVEGLGNGALHPVQQALVECHGSQCGFCTPGFAMSLFGLYKNAHRPARPDVDDALSGNLCRCTGYRPILDAAQRMYEIDPGNCGAVGWRAPGVGPDGTRIVSEQEKALAAELVALRRHDTLACEGAGQRAFVPVTLDALAALCVAHPDARLVAGATDVGLWITKQQRELGTLIFTGNVRELHAIRVAATHVEIGAAACLTDAFAALDGDFPELSEAWQRFASVPIRNSGTLGGNIANGSPIGDSMPALIALGATIVLRRGDSRRELPLEDFYLAYQKTARAPGEFVETVRVPRREETAMLRAYKVSKRFDQDISAVFAVFALTIRRARVERARIACGGVAPTPVRATATEAALVGTPWTEATARKAADLLAREFTPITDMRASADYRSTVLGNLLVRCFMETAGDRRVPTRVRDVLVQSPEAGR